MGRTETTGHVATSFQDLTFETKIEPPQQFVMGWLI